MQEHPLLRPKTAKKGSPSGPGGPYSRVSGAVLAVQTRLASAAGGSLGENFGYLRFWPSPVSERTARTPTRAGTGVCPMCLGQQSNARRTSPTPPQSPKLELHANSSAVEQLQWHQARQEAVDVTGMQGSLLEPSSRKHVQNSGLFADMCLSRRPLLGLVSGTQASSRTPPASSRARVRHDALFLDSPQIPAAARSCAPDSRPFLRSRPLLGQASKMQVSSRTYPGQLSDTCLRSMISSRGHVRALHFFSATPKFTPPKVTSLSR